MLSFRPSDHADHMACHSPLGNPDEFYRTVMPLSSTTITLDGKTYKVFPGGHYGRSEPCVQKVIDQYGPRFTTHGEALSSALMRYWDREMVEGCSKGWVYVKRVEGMAELPKSFWLHQVHATSGDER